MHHHGSVFDGRGGVESARMVNKSRTRASLAPVADHSLIFETTMTSPFLSSTEPPFFPSHIRIHNFIIFFKSKKNRSIEHWRHTSVTPDATGSVVFLLLRPTVPYNKEGGKKKRDVWRQMLKINTGSVHARENKLPKLKTFSMMLIYFYSFR